MPGNGTIGGGSCDLDFAIGPSNNPHTKWSHADTAQKCPFTLTITVYNGRRKGALRSVQSGTYTVQIKKGDKVTLDW